MYKTYTKRHSETSEIYEYINSLYDTNKEKKERTFG
jgi:hypothetical protein